MLMVIALCFAPEVLLAQGPGPCLKLRIYLTRMLLITLTCECGPVPGVTSPPIGTPQSPHSPRPSRPWLRLLDYIYDPLIEHPQNNYESRNYKKSMTKKEECENKRPKECVKYGVLRLVFYYPILQIFVSGANIQERWY
jgi:hypothetical protein